MTGLKYYTIWYNFYKSSSKYNVQRVLYFIKQFIHKDCSIVITYNQLLIMNLLLLNWIIN